MYCHCLSLFTERRESTESDSFQIECLVSVEQEPGEVAHEKGEDDGDEDHAQTDLLLLVPPSEPGDGQVDPNVHDGNQGEGEQAQEHQPRPAVVEDVVHWVGPQLGGHDPDQVSVLVTPDNLRLEKG